MRPTFFGLEIARTGLTVSQRGLDVTGHNIANVDTEGYTRQRIVNTAYEPYSVLYKLRPVEQALVGAGAHTIVLDQIRSKYLDRQYRTEAAIYNYWNSRTQGLEYMESLFEGSDGTGILDYFDFFFKAIDTQTLEANDKDPRIIIKGAGESLTMSINLIYRSMVEKQQGHSEQVQIMTGDINEIAKQIAALNKNIYAYELDGQRANDLRDKRNLLLDKLSEIVDIEYEETVDNQLQVWIGDSQDPDQLLVSHLQIRELTVTTETDPVTGVEYYKPQWTDGSELNFNAGQLRAAFDLSANSAPEDALGNPQNVGIPYYMEQLNIMVRALVQSINDIHSAGYTHPAADAVAGSQTGINFFWDGGGDINAVNAGNFRLSDEIMESVYNVASSTRMILRPGDPGYDETVTENGNNENIRAIYDLLNKTDLQLTNSDGSTIAIGSIFGFVSGLITEFATTLNHSKRTSENEAVMILNAENSRLSVSGVSLDEEMVNMIKYQHAYAGASRVITTMDEALDVLINKTGIVGR